jgi:hypothetical protein
MCYVEIIYCAHRNGLPITDFRDSECKDYIVYPCNEDATADQTKLCFHSKEPHDDWKARLTWDSVWVDNLKYPPWPLRDDGVGFCPQHYLGTEWPGGLRPGKEPSFENWKGAGRLDQDDDDPPNGKVLTKRTMTDLLMYNKASHLWEVAPEISDFWIWRGRLGWIPLFEEPKCI